MSDNVVVTLTSALPSEPRPAICLGGTFRLPPAPKALPASPESADPGRIRLGGTFRLPRA